MENLSIDNNMRNILGAVTNDANQDIRRVRVNPITGAIVVEATITSTNTQIGSTIPGGTAGSVLFLDIGSTLAQDNTYFFYDPTNHYLALGHNSPNSTLDIEGTFRYSDGSEVNGYFLTTDGSGNATWSALTANGYSLVQDDGSSVTQRTTLNFVNFFIVSDVSSKTQINLDTTAIGNDTTLQNTLIASTNFTTNLANNANFISTLTSNATFISNVVTQVNLTGTLTVVTDGVTITGNGTTGSPLVAVAGGQASIQFEDEGVNLGTSGTATEVDFVGAGVTATRVSNKITVTIPGGGGGGTCVTCIPLPCVPIAGGISKLVTGNTTGYIGQIIVPNTITANKISIMSGNTVTTSGTYKITLYAEDGQSQIFSVTTGTVSAINTVYTTALSSAVITQGVYYLLVQPVSTVDATLYFYNASTLPFLGTPGLNDEVTSEPVMFGTITVTANTVPATINPVSDIDGSVATSTSIAVRFDN